MSNYYNHNFKKQYGQNFLKHNRFAVKLIEAAEIVEGDQIIEIGPGNGKITQILLERAETVVCIEIDYDLIVDLIRQFNEVDGFEIVHKDVLKIDYEDLMARFQLGEEYKVVGALPYNISKQIVKDLIELTNQPKIMSFIMQEEVVNSYVASAPRATFLSNWLGLRANAKKHIAISSKQFYPTPKVNGAIITIEPHNQYKDLDLSQMDHLLKLGFATPRKTLRNNLKAANEFTNSQVAKVKEKLGLDKDRPAELVLEQWIEIYQILYLTNE